MSADCTIKKINVPKYGNCMLMSNGRLQLTVSLDFGPRILSFCLVGKDNIFMEDVAHTMQTDNGCFYFRGGHRLWHAPEKVPRTYFPDNEPAADCSVEKGVLTVTQKTEDAARIQKQLKISFTGENEVCVSHIVRNCNDWDIEMAAWAISIVGPGGMEILPLCAPDTGFLPNRMLTLWPYSKLNDRRVTFREKYILLKHEPDNAGYFKIGMRNAPGWAAYLKKDTLFVIDYKTYPGEAYPDMGSGYETFVTDWGMEMETFSPLSSVPPGGEIEHTERWRLYDNVSLDAADESDITEALKGKVHTEP
jgi:hypothetical protein